MCAVEWDSESTVALHPSCVAAAMAMKRLLSERDLVIVCH